MVRQGEERQGQTARGQPPDRGNMEYRGWNTGVKVENRGTGRPDRKHGPTGRGKTGADRQGPTARQTGADRQGPTARQTGASPVSTFLPTTCRDRACPCLSSSPVSPLPLSLLFPCLSSSPVSPFPLSLLFPCLSSSPVSPLPLPLLFPCPSSSPVSPPPLSLLFPIWRLAPVWPPCAPVCQRLRLLLSGSSLWNPSAEQSIECCLFYAVCLPLTPVGKGNGFQRPALDPAAYCGIIHAQAACNFANGQQFFSCFFCHDTISCTLTVPGCNDVTQET